MHIQLTFEMEIIHIIWSRDFAITSFLDSRLAREYK